jgi:SH3-like domain-containing protein
VTGVEHHLAGENERVVAVFEAWRRARLAHGGVGERVARTKVSWARKRAFSTAYVKNGYVEVTIDLLREVDHPRLRAAFATTKNSPSAMWSA